MNIEALAAVICAMQDRDIPTASRILAATPRADLEAMAATLAAAVSDALLIIPVRDLGAEIEASALRRAHTAYSRGDRTSEVVEAERAYQRQKARQRRPRQPPAPAGHTGRTTTP